MKFLAFDLETAKIVPPDEDVQAHRPLGISCYALAWQRAKGIGTDEIVTKWAFCSTNGIMVSQPQTVGRSDVGSILRPDTMKGYFMMQPHSIPQSYFPENLDDYAPWVATHGLTAPYGECQCGCGNKTPIAQVTRAARDWKKDHPTRFAYGHRLPKTNGASKKQCSKCKVVKPITEYWLRGAGRAGYMSHCKDCLTAYYRQYYQENRKKVDARNKAYFTMHRDKELARYKRWYAETRVHRAIVRKAYYTKNRQKIIEYNRNYARIWRAANLEKARASVRNRRARLRTAEGQHTSADVKRQYEAQKGKCYWCGDKLTKSYHVDHIVPLARGGANDPSNLVVACAPCNQSKGDKLPHEWPQGGRLI